MIFHTEGGCCAGLGVRFRHSTHTASAVTATYCHAVREVGYVEPGVKHGLHFYESPRHNELKFLLVEVWRSLGATMCRFLTSLLCSLFMT